jgi:sugar lactone lactonase YvrE
LFAFGDVDGHSPQARLQHALGIAYHEGILYVADTYNHKIKRLDPVTGEVTTWLGDGRPGWQDGDMPCFYEPGGLAVLGDRLYIADTNNHVIRVADLGSGRVSTLVLRDPEGLLLASRERRGRAPAPRQPEQHAGAGNRPGGAGAPPGGGAE